MIICERINTSNDSNVKPQTLTTITTHFNHTSNNGSMINKLVIGTTRQMEIKIMEQRK